MKRSNKILTGLVVLFACFFLGNTAFHVYRLEHISPVLVAKHNFLIWADHIKVVSMQSSDTMLLSKFRIEPVDEYSRCKTEQQALDLYRNFRLCGDTMIITSRAAYVVNRHNNMPEYSIGLPKVKQLYWNGKLVKRF